MIVKGLIESKKIIFRELVYTIRHKLNLLKSIKYKKSKDLKLNLGSGKIIKSGWLNIDIDSDKADLNLDLRKKLPFSSRSCSEVYSEHFLEHLEYPDETLGFIGETYRVLKTDGILTIAVPDSEWPLKEYVKKGRSKYFEISKSKKWHPKWFTSKIEHINFHFRQGGEHKYAYDFDLLSQLLSKVGFINIKRRNFNPKHDSKFHHPGTLYVVANKK